jgi:ATP-dependent helicase/DNAse subunit B
MATHLYLAPAGHGKTAYVLERIRQARAADPLAPITVILPNQPQVDAFRRRLSDGGGALGVNLGTFYNLYAEVLAWAGQPEPRLPEAVQYRLLRTIVLRLTGEGRLIYYAPLSDKPGFVTALRVLIEELKRARIRRDDFRQAVHSLPRRDPRLLELAEIYAAYQDWLLDNGWVDLEGQGWLAALALERQPDLGRHLHLLLVDGFDEFNPTQLEVLKFLSQRAAETLITLTGTRGHEDTRTRGHEEAMTNDVSSPPRLAVSSRPVLRRFTRALQAVSQALALEPEPLPASPSPSIAPALAYLEANLFEVSAQTPPPTTESQPLSTVYRLPSTITFLETQNRAEEARAALRWLKARLIRDELLPPDVALIARDLAAYRPFIEEIAAEFGLTLHWREGLSLTTNPAIAALLSLLALPLKSGADGNWSRRPLIDTWRSPYFENLIPGLTPAAADRLDAVARQGLVMQGLDQWREALRVQTLKRSTIETPADEDFWPPDQLTPADAAALQTTFEAFVTRLTPPPRATLREFAAFVENLIGDDPELGKDEGGRPVLSAVEGMKGEELPPDNSLLSSALPGFVNRVRAKSSTRSRDLAALRAFKDVLRGLVLTGTFFEAPGQAAESELMTYDLFYAELAGAVEGATYYLPPPEPLQAAIPVLSVVNARGLSFRAVALIGLAEGDFPRAEREDILLREEDRPALRQIGLADLETRLRGDEISLFYQAVTRAREKLLLCRPYLADDGQTWEASPYWAEVRRLAAGAPVQHLRPEDPLPWSEVASPPELAGALALLGLADFELLPYWSNLDTARLWHGATVLRARLAVEPEGPFEGDLSDLADRLAMVYGPDHVWSASRLEAYGICPHHFWLAQDLALEARQPPAEGYDVFILGSMYHEILEEVYRQTGTQADGEHLLALLPGVAQKVFDEAPRAYGFRPTALWQIQRRELEQIMANTLVALAEATQNSTPLAQEQIFGMRDQPPLVVQREGDEFRLRGFIDRVDQDAAGRLCLIDYKSGSTPITAGDLVAGRRLQIALYALAARDALALGEVADGFYWHIGSTRAGSAKASSLKLADFEGGVEGALATALTHTFNHIAGVRAGHFPPVPPPAGCPSHCPGMKFCWRYEAKR